MASTYEPIATQTLGSSASSVTFSSIPSTYTDLVLIVMAKNVNGDSDLAMQFNSNTSGYSSTFVYGNGSSALSTRNTNLTKMRIGRIDNTNAYPNIINIQNYSNATTYKTALSRSQNSSLVLANVGLWGNTSAITSVTILDDNSYSLASGSTFTLYGIKAA
jgi:hypothetical protein